MNRTRHSISSPTSGTGGPGRDEQHRGLHVRRLGEQALLAADGVRRAHQPGCVEPATGDRGGPGPQGRVAGRAPRGRCRGTCRRRRPGSCRAAGPSGRGSRRCRRARPGGRPGRSRAPERAPRSPSHRQVPMRGRKVNSGYFCASSVELDLGEVGDPDRAAALGGRACRGRRRPRRSSAARPRSGARSPERSGRAAGAARHPRPGRRRRRRQQAGPPRAGRGR